MPDHPMRLHSTPTKVFWSAAAVIGCVLCATSAASDGIETRIDTSNSYSVPASGTAIYYPGTSGTSVPVLIRKAPDSNNFFNTTLVRTTTPEGKSIQRRCTTYTSGVYVRTECY